MPARAPTLLLCLLLPVFVSASELARSRAELSELGERIERLTARIEKDDEARDRITAELDRVGERLAALTGEIREAVREEAALEGEIAALEKESAVLEMEREEAQAGLAGLLRSRYMMRDGGALRMLINQEDPHAAARRLNLLRYVASAGERELRRIDDLVSRIHENRASLDSRREQLAATREGLSADRESLAAEQAEHDRQLAAVRQRIAESGAEIALYREREAALGALIRELAKPRASVVQVAPRARSTAGPTTATETAPAAPSAAAPVPAPAAPEPTTTVAPENPAPLTAPPPRPTFALGGFANQRGRLALPVDAPLSARFGDVRQAGGLPWEGVLFDSGGGQPVRAIYSGQVVFSDWFRGYGQLMVVDHGEGYMSLYGYNERLDAGVGDLVEAGQVIASASAAGAPPARGMYFEVRHNGTPDDPLKWCR